MEKRLTEAQARLMPTCPCCGRPKRAGSTSTIMCWSCFKDGTDPFKLSNLSLADWLDKNKKI